MELLTFYATIGFCVFVVVTLIKGVTTVWNLQEREERIIEQNERQLELLEKIANALDQSMDDPKKGT